MRQPDVMWQPDAKLWCDAFCDEIKAIIVRKPGHSYSYRLEDSRCHWDGSVKSNVMQQMSLKNTRVTLLSKDLYKRLNWISIKCSLLSLELTQFTLSSPYTLPMILVSPKSTARTPFSIVEAISRYISNNLKDSSTAITVMLCYYSTKLYMASNKHYVYGTYFYRRSL